nr:endonuclease/exonuclease/phosphatase family protein [Tanacetum cinerariifolium]
MTVNGRSRKQRAITTSYYFTDISTGWIETALWKLFAKYGKVYVRTKCMNVILQTMPILVDDSHMCIRGLNKELENGGGWIREEDEEHIGCNRLRSEFDRDGVDYVKLPKYLKIQGKLPGQPSLTVESKRRNMEYDFCGTFVPNTEVLETSKYNHVEKEIETQTCKVQEVQASNTSSGDKDCSKIVSDKGNDQGLENQSNTSGDESSRSRNECNDKSTSGDDTDIRPSYDTEPMVEVPYTAEYNVFVVDT